MLCCVGSVLKIQRAFHLLYRLAQHAVGIEHSRPHVAVAQERLDRQDVVVGLEEVPSQAHRLTDPFCLIRF
jgi:hypothetical protein